MSNLKPCPFCGSETSEDGNGGVFCDNAECFILALWLDQTGCANDWNTRPIEDQLRTRIAELEALCAMQQEHEQEVGADLMRAVKWAALWKRCAKVAIQRHSDSVGYWRRGTAGYNKAMKGVGRIYGGGDE